MWARPGGEGKQAGVGRARGTLAAHRQLARAARRRHALCAPARHGLQVPLSAQLAHSGHVRRAAAAAATGRGREGRVWGGGRGGAWPSGRPGRLGPCGRRPRSLCGRATESSGSASAAGRPRRLRARCPRLGTAPACARFTRGWPSPLPSQARASTARTVQVGKLRERQPRQRHASGPHLAWPAGLRPCAAPPRRRAASSGRAGGRATGPVDPPPHWASARTRMHTPAFRCWGHGQAARCSGRVTKAAPALPRRPSSPRCHSSLAQSRPRVPGSYARAPIPLGWPTTAAPLSP